MTISVGMAKGKIDNAWIAAGLKATQRPKKELAELLEIDAGGVTRILKNARSVSYEEANQIKDWFRRFNYNVPQKSLSGDESLNAEAQTTARRNPAEGGQEEAPMSDKVLAKFIEMLIDDVKDLKAKLRKFEEGEAGQSGTRKRRKGP